MAAHVETETYAVCEAYAYWAKKFCWRACMLRGEAKYEQPEE